MSFRLTFSVVALLWLHAGLARPGAFGEAFRALQLGPVIGGAGAAAMLAGNKPGIDTTGDEEDAK